MVQAILEGRKTMTRRVIKNADVNQSATDLNWISEKQKACKYGQPGDLLWVRESFYDDCEEKYFYKSDYSPNQLLVRWTPSLFMPKSAARLWLEIKNIRVERLQDITFVEILQEGYTKEHTDCSPIEWFENLWTKINGQNSWDTNPWVWVIEFRRIEK